MSILDELLQWSESRPVWQKDALRRLIVNEELTDDDIIELTELCKSTHGLLERQEGVPLAAKHIPVSATNVAPASLVSIFHHRGVNALAEKQTLKFSPNLTIVYGDNGAGKTGYIRILKDACRARGTEEILGNVVSGTTPLSPSVAIKYQVANESESREWIGGGEDEFISRVSIFDTQCASVHLSTKTDVAFRPYGLDLFDKLVQACKAIRIKLESERRALSADSLAGVQTQVPKDTAAAKFLMNISPLTTPEQVKELTQFSKEEEAELVRLEKSLLDLQANDPKKLINLLTLRANRVKKLTTHLKNVEMILSTKSVTTVLKVRAEGRRKKEEAKQLREATFSAGTLSGTGTESWRLLWKAARSFSEDKAYQGKRFPVTENGAHCVLCQQTLDHEASDRLKNFETFLTSTTERTLQQLREKFTKLRSSFSDLLIKTEPIEETLKEICIEDASIADTISEALIRNEERRQAILIALSEDSELTACPDLLLVSQETEILTAQIESRLKTLQTNANGEVLKRMTKQIQELRARKVLGKYEQGILDEIERRKKHAVYGLCIDDTETRAITKKSTTLTKTIVSQTLKQSFQNELKNLGFRHVEVELKEMGGKDGIFYHKLVLKRAPGVDLKKVVSEGEQRCLSIAAFFSELSTADDPSGIVFDDPVSSLDFQWRHGVARRLVQESKTRQVIIFTHDVVFLLMLNQCAKEIDVRPFHQHIRHLFNGAGVCIDELPWVALPVKKKIGHLKTAWQAADKLYRNNSLDAYEKEAAHIYGLLREAWERALEEVLIGGVVERYRPSVQTQQIAQIADITPDDCKAIDTAMSKCSTWLAGHDQAAAARAPVPDTLELKADIDAIESWVATIRNRRKK